MSRRPVRVGTFLPPEEPSTPGGGDIPGLGKVPPTALTRFWERASSLEGVEFLQDLDIRRSFIRGDRVYCGDICLNDLDLYVWYAEVDRHLGSYALEALKTLSADTPVLPDPFAFEVGLDKYQSHLALRRAGVRVADAVLFDHHNVAAVAPVMEQWGRAVLKPRWGYFGRGVLYVEDFPALRDLVGYMQVTTGGSPDRAFLLERFYENDPDESMGTTIIGGSLMYGYRKRPTRRAAIGEGGWKVFDREGLGGHVDLSQPSAAHVEQALRAQKALGVEIIGFDMLLYEGEPVIVDENTFPGLYPELFAAVGRDLGDELFRTVATTLQPIMT
ncbi:MAG: hypothetical protein M3N47_09565 [Chloroflexota bacterium]|nr:hypothetical protein [Chloroflexota bacterium]